LRLFAPASCALQDGDRFEASCLSMAIRPSLVHIIAHAALTFSGCFLSKLFSMITAPGVQLAVTIHARSSLLLSCGWTTATCILTRVHPGAAGAYVMRNVRNALPNSTCFEIHQRYVRMTFDRPCTRMLATLLTRELHRDVRLQKCLELFTRHKCLGVGTRGCFGARSVWCTRCFP
jgi:hypothetical protein